MKLVTAFVGSARKAGVTARATRLLLEDLETRGGVESELVFLSDFTVGTCRGCKACFLRGEETCPLHDDRDVLLEKLMRSDGVVLASPNYSFQVSGHLKVFLDRLGFAFHRPRFHGKAFTSVVAEGLFGGKAIVRYLDLVGRGLGFNVVHGCCVTARKNPNTAHDPLQEDERRRMEEAVAALGRRFHAQLSSPPFPAPSLVQLLAFRMARTSIAVELGEDDRDHAYYRERGWFDADYWYPTTLGPVKRAAGAVVDRLAARSSRSRAYHPPER
jgi:multimeric flavodoxin WrbA